MDWVIKFERPQELMKEFNLPKAGKHIVREMPRFPLPSVKAILKAGCRILSVTRED